MAKILIAAAPQGMARMRSILGTRHEVSVAGTIQEAREVAEKCDVIVCGLEFDESRMFDLLRDLKSSQTTQNKPCVSVRFVHTNTPDTVLDGLELASKAVGAAVFLDLPELERTLGEAGANREALKQVESLLAS